MTLLQKPNHEPPDGPELNFVQCSGDRVSGVWLGASGLIGLCSALVAILKFHLSMKLSAVVILVGTALPMIGICLFANRVFDRPSAGLVSTPRCFDLFRVTRKFLGFLFTLSALFSLYWILPEYHKKEYQEVWSLAKYLVASCLILAIPYILWVDARQQNPCDIYWQLGGLFTGKCQQINRKDLKKHALVWAVKGFFLPLMIRFLFKNIGRLQAHGLDVETFPDFYESILTLVFITDVTYGCIGYLLTLRLLDSHVRQPEFSLLGWAATLICYPPFVTFVSRKYDVPKEGFNWEHWFAHWPIAYISWGFLILVSWVIYTWATVCFACRFSNLTNRGIITFGPYQWMKHPAYFFKCLGWWLILLPFAAYPSVFLSFQASLLLTLRCGVYWLRARSEEKLLGLDPAYVAYSQWIDQNGWWAQIKKFYRRSTPKLR